MYVCIYMVCIPRPKGCRLRATGAKYPVDLVSSVAMQATMIAYRLSTIVCGLTYVTLTITYTNNLAIVS